MVVSGGRGGVTQGCKGFFFLKLHLEIRQLKSVGFYFLLLCLCLNHITVILQVLTFENSNRSRILKKKKKKPQFKRGKSCTS